jgi:tetratricopeptide (TPR) repeat protein
VNHRIVGLILAVGTLLPSAVLAQPGAGTTTLAGSSDRKQMYEDIEILRRLLNSKLQSQYSPLKEAANAGQQYWGLINNTATWNQFPTLDNANLWGHLSNNQLGNTNFFRPMNPNAPVPNVTGNVDWAPLVSQVNDPQLSLIYNPANQLAHGRLLDTEGVYLKGQGVVYTLTLPSPKHEPKLEPHQPAPKPVSEWERARRELHHEKAAEEKEPPHKEPGLPEIILKVLAENGHHFAQLGENESLTVVVTFRGHVQPTELLGNWSTYNQATSEGQGQRSVTGNIAQAQPGQLATPPGKEPASSAHDYELLGELHLSQGKVEEAIKALRQALEMEPKPTPKQGAALYRKLAEALLRQGKLEEARQALEKAQQFAKTAEAGAQEANKPAAAPRQSLPAKLMISVPKKALDLIGGGKITMEEFQKTATVESLNFPPAQP